jgi:hypothetical protein
MGAGSSAMAGGGPGAGRKRYGWYEGCDRESEER